MEELGCSTQDGPLTQGSGVGFIKVDGLPDSKMRSPTSGRGHSFGHKYVHNLKLLNITQSERTQFCEANMGLSLNFACPSDVNGKL